MKIIIKVLIQHNNSVFVVLGKMSEIILNIHDTDLCLEKLNLKM